MTLTQKIITHRLSKIHEWIWGGVGWGRVGVGHVEVGWGVSCRGWGGVGHVGVGGGGVM